VNYVIRNQQQSVIHVMDNQQCTSVTSNSK
jgi:hypothetical protein